MRYKIGILYCNFFVFFPTFIFYFYVILPNKNLIYILFSIIFYFFGEGWYTLLVLIYVLMNFFFGIWIDISYSDKHRRTALEFSITLNLLPLFFFKYFKFFWISVMGYPADNWVSSIHLPLGISFFTFHAISYVVDVYRRDARAERSFVNLSLYLLMFPQLISGPILRFHKVARQLRRRVVTARHIYYGLVLFFLGMGQKVLLADTMAGICDPLFAHYQSMSTQTAWLAAVSYTFQIFFDFGGYSNMAIGLGWITGFYFPRNFNYPYISTSITEFWQRWHMSLSQWFRDYLYIPLGGNRKGHFTTYRNLIFVFLLCGLWHGAAWTFILWGAYHGLLLVIERLGFDRVLRRMPRILRHCYTMLAVIFGWVLFRSDDVGQAVSIMSTMITPTASDDVTVWERLSGEEIVALIAACLFSTHIISRLLKTFAVLPTMPPWKRNLPIWSYGVGLTCALIVIAASSIKILSGAYSPFIYYRF